MGDGMKKKQREKHKREVKEFMENKRKYNKSHPDEHEIKKLKHKGEHAVRFTIREKREIRKWRKKKIRQTKNALRDKLITESEYKKRVEEIKSK